MKIEQWGIEKLIPYARNPRRNDQAVERVASAIKEFGFRVPIIAKSDGSVVDGHLRLKAAQKLGLDLVPVVLADDMTETQIKAFRISVNRMAELAEWDNELLALEIEDLRLDDYDIDLTGFDADELGALVGEVEGGLTDPDEVPEPPADPVSKPGDIWLLGKHRLMCGDSTDSESVARLMGGEKADMVFTDPMYNDDPSDFIGVIDMIGVKHIVLMTTFKQAITVITKSSWAFKFDTVLYFKTPSSMMNKLVPYYLHKNVFYMTAHGAKESIFSCDNAKGVFSENGYYPSVIEARKNTQEEHGLTKPVDAIVKILSGYKAQSIIDLFSGSGTTIIAAEQTGRTCYAMELQPQYVDVAVRRWQEFTGRQAVHAETGEQCPQS